MRIVAEVRTVPLLGAVGPAEAGHYAETEPVLCPPEVLAKRRERGQHLVEGVVGIPPAGIGQHEYPASPSRCG